MSLPKKIFISYKYSDVVESQEKKNFRDCLIKLLDGQGFIYKGEDVTSKDLSPLPDTKIGQIIGPDIKRSSITIVLLSEHAKDSKWIDWEVSYSLRARAFKEENDMTRNGIIAIALPCNENLKHVVGSDNYDWVLSRKKCDVISWYTWKLPSLIESNVFNHKDGGKLCKKGCCKNTYYTNDTYIILATWDQFIKNQKYYIEKAWENRENFDEFDSKINLNG